MGEWWRCFRRPNKRLRAGRGRCAGWRGWAGGAGSETAGRRWGWGRRLVGGAGGLRGLAGCGVRGAVFGGGVVVEGVAGVPAWRVGGAHGLRAAFGVLGGEVDAIGG